MNANTRAKLAHRHDLDRQRVEEIARRLYVRVLARALRLATSTYEVGGDVSKAIRIGLDPLREQIATGMVLGHLEGMRRTSISVNRWVNKGIRLSSAYDGAIDFLKRRLDLDDADLVRLNEQYSDVAATATGQMFDAVEQRVQRAILENTREGGGVRDGVKAIRQAMEDAGVTPAKPYQIETIVRTQTQLAYSAGRQNALNDPAIQEILWGFEFAATIDDRVTELCASLDGTRLPKDDPFWSRYIPPLHFNCRSTVLEVFNDEQQANSIEPPDDVEQPGEGFDFNPGDAYGSLVGVTVTEFSRDRPLGVSLRDPLWRVNAVKRLTA